MLNVHFINYEGGKMLPGNSSLQLRFVVPPIFRGRIWAIKMYTTVNIQYMYMAICIVIFALQEIYTKGSCIHKAKKTSVRKQFFEKWNRYFLTSYLFILISQCIKYTYSTNVYSTCTTCTHTTSCTSIQQTTNLGLHARTVLSDLEITWCFEVEFFRSLIGFAVNWCLLNWLQLIR